MVTGRHGQQRHDKHDRGHHGYGGCDVAYPAAGVPPAVTATTLAAVRRRGVAPAATGHARTVVAGRLRAARAAVPVVLRGPRGRRVPRAHVRRWWRCVHCVPTVRRPPAPPAPPAATALGGRGRRRTVARVIHVGRRIRRGRPTRRTGLTAGAKSDDTKSSKD